MGQNWTIIKTHVGFKLKDFEEWMAEKIESKRSRYFGLIRKPSISDQALIFF